MTLGFILFYIVLVLIRPQEYIQSMEEAPILSSVFVVTFIIWFLSVKKEFQVPQPLLMTSFFAVAVISVAASGWVGGSFEAFKELLPGWGLFIMLSMTVDSARKVRVVLDVIAVCAFVIAVHSIEQKVTGYGWTGLPIRPDDGRVHYLGIFNDPNDLGTLLVSTIPVLIHWFGREVSATLKIIYMVMMGALLTSIYLTDSRGSLLAVGVVLLMEFWKRFGAVKAGILGSVLAGVGLAYTRLSQLDVNEASAAGRLDAWYQGIEMFKANPLLGVGFQNFTEYHYQTAHNSFVLVLAETGVVGFFFWLSIILVTFVIIVNFLRKDRQELGVPPQGKAFDTWQDYRSIAWTYLVILCGYMTTIFFLSRSYDTYFNIVLGAAAGLCLALQKNYQALPKFRIVDRMGNWAASTAGGVVVIYLVVKVLLKMQA